MVATLKIEINPGCHILRAAEDAQTIADILRCDVEFTFNGVKCLAQVGGSPDVLAEAQKREQGRELETPRDRRIATIPNLMFRKDRPMRNATLRLWCVIFHGRHHHSTTFDPMFQTSAWHCQKCGISTFWP